jgi:molecular chaperone DnaK
MQYGLGIDLGTTKTAAAVNVDGRVEVVRLGGRRAEIPSLVFVTPDGGLLIGDPAERRGQTEPGRLAREFKRRIGDPVPILVGGVPFSAHALTGKLLRHVLDAVTRLQDGPPAAITVTFPANWGPYKRELLDQAVKIADVGGVRLRSEPEAAALQHATARRIAPGETVAVYDLGGGTFDVAVLRREGDGFVLLGEPEGIEQLGGVDFDEAVFGHVIGVLGSMAEGLDPGDDEVVAALTRLRRDCVEAKESLSFDTETMIPVALPGLHTRVRLNRSELESMIAPSLADTITATHRALRTAGVTPTELSAVLLAGGSSRIPLVAQLLSTEFEVPVVADPHPEHSIAMGAAVATAAATGGGSPFAAAVPPSRAGGSVPDSTLVDLAAGDATTPARPQQRGGGVAAGGSAAVPAHVPSQARVSAQPATQVPGHAPAPIQARTRVSGQSSAHPPASSAAPTPTRGSATAAASPSHPPVAFSRGAATVPGTAPTPAPPTPALPTPALPTPVLPTGLAAGSASVLGAGNAAPVGAGHPASPDAGLAAPPGSGSRSGAPAGGTSPGGTSPGGAPWPPPPAAPDGRGRTRRRLLIAGALAVVLLAGGTATALALTKGDGGDDDKNRTTVAGTGPTSAAAVPPPLPFPTDTMLVRVDTGGANFPERKSKVYLLKPGSDQRTPLPNSVAGDVLPKWSADRSQIALTHVEQDGTSAVYVMNADGSARHVVVKNGGGRPAWSADGKKVGFVRKIDGVAQLFTVVLATGKQTQLTHSSDVKDDPVWTPDGKSIIYWVVRGGGIKQIYELNVADPQEPGRQITDADIGSANDPAPSPDGEQVLFTRESGKGETATFDIWSVGIDGADPHRITTSGEREMDPTWAPNGKWFAFIRGPLDRPHVVIARADGSDERTLTQGAAREGHPCWF